jgi:hypothetical protein
MWDRDERDEERLAQIADAIRLADEALAANDRAALRAAQALLASARIDAEPDDPQWDACFDRTRAVEVRLDAFADETLTPCPSCGGLELLVARECSLEGFYVANAGAELSFTTVVCRACGDLRMRCEDPGALLELTSARGGRCFHTVQVQVARRPPFR